MTAISSRYTLTIAPAKTSFSAMDYGVGGWLDWDTPPTTFTHDDLRSTMEQHNFDLNDLNSKVVELEKQLRSALADAETAKKKSPKKKSPPKKKELGANLTKEKVLQDAGTLAPFREGGCRCRTWGEQLGSQCGNKAKDGYNGMCMMHGKKVQANGSWHLGFYDEHRPEIWGEDYTTGAKLMVPKHEKAGGKIAWTMEQDKYDLAFGVAPVPPAEDPPSPVVAPVPAEIEVAPVGMEPEPEVEEPVPEEVAPVEEDDNASTGTLDLELEDVSCFECKTAGQWGITHPDHDHLFLCPVCHEEMYMDEEGVEDSDEEY